MIQKKTKKILLKRLKGKNKSGEKQEQKSAGLKNIEGFPQPIGRRKKNAYPYL
jgi:hypothetical protein